MLATIRAALSSSAGADEEIPTRPARYDDEDTTPTSPREIAGWYCYGIAAEVFAVCGVGSFLPLTLEQLARENGTLQTSRLPCWGSSAPENKGDEQCVVHVLGLQTTTASFAMYTFSLAVLVQALTLISFSALADYERNRKSLLLSFGLIGSATSMMFILVAPSVFILGSILVVIGVTCLGSSFVVLNSFLPLLVANHPTIRGAGAGEDEGGVEEMADLSGNNETNEWGAWEDNDSLNAMPADEDHRKASGHRKIDQSESSASSLQLSTKISSKGVGLGYCAAVLVQILSIILLILLNKTALAKKSGSIPLRFILLVVGIWWCAFTLVTRQWLRDRPGPPLATSKYSRQARWRVWLRLVGFAWKSLWQTVTIAVRLRQVIVFLVAWFLLSDAMATVSGTAILFARTELHMSTTAIGCLSVTVTLSGMAGAFLWPHVSRRLGLESNQTIMVCIALFELIPLYGMLAYIPFVKRWGVIGLQQPWEIFPLGIIHGIVSGGLASYCRSFFGLLIPPGSEAAFYALYAATDKGSSFIGPAIVGVLIDATSTVRVGFVFIAVLIVLPIPLVWMVNAEKGRQEALAMAASLSKSHDFDRGNAEDGMEAEGLLARRS
ncbi:MFS transporter family protein [Penicillium diatomitis]|uniref:Autophagy-related protein n=1 Tax=Penicillium diatomitis TaxID=2819901 RepID=A0A9W9WTP5_9EURO|nr:MFS transporter family protein [Penicillium diatomitis]KAJ5475356.1 MFS transporter family protein [Penicillium diatomitis]